MKYEILSMLILWSVSGSTVVLCLDRIRSDYIVKLVKFTSVVRLGFGSKFEFELDFENFI